jgi:hypothetical protein
MSDTDIANGNGEVDVVRIDEIIGELQNMKLLIQLNNEQYSPGLVAIITQRMSENLEIEKQLRKWASDPPNDRYPYPERYTKPTTEVQTE